MSFVLLRALLWVTLSLAVPSAPLWAQAATPTPSADGVATLTGRLVQGTADAAPPSAQPLTLTTLVSSQPTDSRELTTDADGSFRAEGLSTDPARTYIVSTVYAGVPYQSAPVAPTDGTLPDLELTVYEPTDDASGLYISRLNWVIDYAPGEVIVAQIVSFGNRLDRAYVGQPVEGIALPATTALVLPTGATDITFQGGILGGRYKQVGDRIYDVAAVPPGVESQQTVMSFRVPYEGNAVRIEQPFLYEIAEANLLAAELPEGSAMQLDVLTPEADDALSFSGSEAVQGNAFSLWTGANLAPQTIVLDFSGLIPPGGNDPRGNDPRDSSGRDLFESLRAPEAVPWTLGGVVAAALAAIFVWSLRRQPHAGLEVDHHSAQQTLAAERDALVQRIAQLDDQHAIGILPDERWSRDRARLKSRLLEVAGQLAQVDSAPAQQGEQA